MDFLRILTPPSVVAYLLWTSGNEYEDRLVVSAGGDPNTLYFEALGINGTVIDMRVFNTTVDPETYFMESYNGTFTLLDEYSQLTNLTSPGGSLYHNESRPSPFANESFTSYIDNFSRNFTDIQTTANCSIDEPTGDTDRDTYCYLTNYVSRLKEANHVKKRSFYGNKSCRVNGECGLGYRGCVSIKDPQTGKFSPGKCFF